MLARSEEQVQQHLDILLADGKTTISALITQQSAERLQLQKGKEVLALIKAPWIDVYATTSTAPATDNVLAGRIQTIQQGVENSELLITLNGEKPCVPWCQIPCLSNKTTAGNGCESLF